MRDSDRVIFAVFGRWNLDNRDWLSLTQLQGRFGSGSPGTGAGLGGGLASSLGGPWPSQVAPQFTWVPLKCLAASQGW